MNYCECVRTYSFSVLSSFVCQPRPAARKNSTTPRDKRRVVCTFVGNFWGPRTFKRPSLYALTTSGTTSEAGRIRLKSSFVSSLTSPFLSISGFFIIFYLSFVRFPQRDYTNSAGAHGKRQHMQSSFYKSCCDKALFCIFVPIIDNNFCGLPLKHFSIGKINPTCQKGLYPFPLVPFIPHNLIVTTIKPIVKAGGEE